MNDYAVSAAAYLLTLRTLWLITRKDPKVSRQWRRPIGILFRAAVLFLIFHIFFVVCNIPILQGYLFVTLFVALSMVGAFLDIFDMGMLALAWIFYEWIFWFPTRDEIILSHQHQNQPKEKICGPRKLGRATTNLQPIGKVEIDGKEFEARSSLGFISKGEQVEIEKEDGFELLVRKA